ncbi:MAG TPA: potassium-transporting ATPase subunit KdpA [Myxococcaceae bacterium]|nr:potassium-transporting ATPase subunit KdpA [Myxococcaceae bacterium]
MTLAAWGQLALYVALILLITKPLGAYMHRVFEGDRRPLPRVLGPVERFLFRLSGVDPNDEQTWVRYTGSVLVFSLFGVLVTYAILRLQHLLPFNPQKFGAVEQGLAFNTSASFTTNTNWQAYSGESTMSYLSQMAGLAWHNFVSAAAGIGIAIALARGLTRRRGPDAPRTLGNFWADLIRATIYVLLPLSLMFAMLLVSQGVIQNLSAYREVTTVEGAKQVVALGPVASQEAIKELGTNGGGFFNANSAHPFENPSPFTNLVEMWLIFAIPAGLTYTYGRMARDTRQGWAILAAMSVLFLGGALVAHWAESRPNQALASLSLDHGAGNMEGKEVRFGTAASALFATVTTDASCGAVNAAHDSFNPLGGLVPLVNIQLGEVIFGGVGAGLYGILIFVVLSVFIAGLMVGRTPEYLGKKVESREMKLAMLYILIFPLIILGLTAWASVSQWGTSSLNNAGPHGLSEMLYAFTSGTGNNGSAFAGLNANTTWWNTLLAIAMLGGRFLMIIPALGIAGSMVGKKVVPAGPGTFPTNGPLFTFLLVSVVLIVGALTFFPALSLGPIVEHFAGLAGKVY